MNHPGLLSYQGSLSRLPSESCVALPPSKSQLIRRLFIHSIRNLPLPVFASGLNLPADVEDAFSLLKSVESRRQQGQYQSEDLVWDAGEAGTVMRFGLTFLVAQGCGGILTGTGRACQRPIGDLVNALLSCGASVEYLDREGYPPLRIQPSVLYKRDLFLNAGVSSQFVSAMVMIAPLLRDADALTGPASWMISWPNDLVSSRPYLEMTVKEMTAAGYPMECLGHAVRYSPALDLPALDHPAIIAPSVSGPTGLHSGPGASRPSVDSAIPGQVRDYWNMSPIEGDWSAASFWIWRQAVIPLCNRLKIHQLTADSLQADRIILDLLPCLAPAMSCCMDLDSCTLFGNPASLPAVPPNKAPNQGSGPIPAAATYNQGVWQIRATDFPDMVPSLVIWSVLSGVPLDLVGISHLRYKESDRLHALAFNLDLLGIPHDILELDGLAIRPISSWKVYSRHFIGDQSTMAEPCRPMPLLRCFGDHRMAMALSMLALPDLPILLDEPHVVRKSYPGFWEEWTKFGYELQALN